MDVLVDGHRTRAFIDTASDVSLMSEARARELGIVPSPSTSEPLRSAGGANRTTGRQSVNLTISDKTKPIEIHIAPKFVHGLLIGCPDAAKFGIEICTITKTARVRQDDNDVYLTTVESKNDESSYEADTIEEGSSDQLSAIEESCDSLSKNDECVSDQPCARAELCYSLSEGSDQVIEEETEETVEEPRITKFLAEIENRKIFAVSDKDVGKIEAYSHRIRVKADQPPIAIRPYRVSDKKREMIREHLDELLEQELIRPSVSPWSAPLHLVRKKNGKTRPVVDYRKLNAIVYISTHCAEHAR